ncbi:potassium/proton antiporter [Moraxella catarrhalis]|uniref:potassium/proton antiporter n=1 Tax=Moraxella catarrhalis TaxID=480 RepID=UPI0007E3DCEE|nr:potassium/proton antiporter [Moraxella catarrhalis]OAV06781.1 Na+/H+ antiporter [Moraxella catarrhalis]OAV13414.1 Na+/H+ antiporter [Moraxella catarrhalis]OAV18951.1 Na+/H+ antiporter [Moraxella catarrhalis]OAV27388.1 Na+/H+ antiporter [Moraxella catarrhalis]
MVTLNILYVVASLLIFASIMTSTLSARLGVPLLLFFLGVGMLAGEEGILGIEFAEYNLANFIGQAALACILLDGGLRTSMRSFRVGLKPAVTLASLGVLVTVLVAGIFATWLLDVDWRLGVLMAAIVGSTDAAAVFSLLRNGGVKLNDRVQATLEIESGANDPLAILLVTAMIALNLDPTSQGIGDIIFMLISQIGIGLVLGLLSGWALSKMLPKVYLADGMYAILILSAGLIVFGITNLLGGSGFLAVYLAGVVIGNTKVRATEHVLRVMDSFAWLSQAVLFVVLGLLVQPSGILEVIHYSLLIFIFLLFVARPIAVFSSLLPFRFGIREIGFISWVGLRGAVPITLAIIPVTMAVPGADLAFNITFGVVILSLLVQGATIPLMSRLFRVWVPTNNEPKAEHEIWVADQANITLYEFEVRQGAFAIGRHPQAISSKFDAQALSLFALVRHNKLVNVNEDTILKMGDVVWYAMRGDDAPSIAKIFNNSATQYQKNSEFYGDWLLSPHARIADLPFYNLAARSLATNSSSRLPKPVASALDIFTVPPQVGAMTGIDEDLVNKLTEAKNQTVEEFMMQYLKTEPVKGDEVYLNETWSLIVRDVDGRGRLRGVGLKNKIKKEV